MPYLSLIFSDVKQSQMLDSDTKISGIFSMKHGSMADFSEAGKISAST